MRQALDWCAGRQAARAPAMCSGESPAEWLSVGYRNLRCSYPFFRVGYLESEGSGGQYVSAVAIAESAGPRCLRQ